MGSNGQRAGVERQLASIFLEPHKASLKRLAWAYGCAKKGSDEEARLLKLLQERVIDESPLECRICGCAYECPACSNENA